MQEIRDPACLETLYRANQQYFGTRPPVIRLLRFEKGEYLSHPLKPLHQFLLVVKGSVRIYGIHEDSRVFGVSYARTDTLLGDIEFCQISHSPFFTEADEPVLCLSLPFAENRAVLENYPVFLRFFMGQLARKLVGGATGWRKTEPEQQNARAGAFLCGRCIFLCIIAPRAAARRMPLPAG